MTRITHNPDPRPLRQRAYPSVGDQLGALWEIVEALLAGQPAPIAALQVKAAIDAVKARYPKGK